MIKKTRNVRIALIGNPNSGKSSLFNALTGLNQKTSNYPGVTVEKKSGVFQFPNGKKVELIDFPGIYSLYPNSKDERIVVDTLTNEQGPNFPDAIIYVATAIELEKHFLLASQLRELKIPMILCLSMSDIGHEKGIKYDLGNLSKYLDIPAIEVSSLTGNNLQELQRELEAVIKTKELNDWDRAYTFDETEKILSEKTGELLGGSSGYRNLLIAHHHKWLSHLSAADRITLASLSGIEGFQSTKLQIKETLRRFNSFVPIIQSAEIRSETNKRSRTELIDRVITDRIYGPLIFFTIMFLIFQAIYAWAEQPMLWIENTFSATAVFFREVLPAGWITDLFTDGLISGLGGIMVFIPQIAILFALIGILEESGYMSRAVFMFDGIMQRFGLNGRSLVALVSSGACAIPAIMSTRTISNWKERIITIMVAPLISCSARIPVYTVLIAFIVPEQIYLGLFNAQGIAFMFLYFIGIAAALLSALVFKLLLKTNEKSYLMIELPQYKKPVVNNLLLSIRDRVGAFVIEAGKVIMIVSVILWFLASYGPSKAMTEAENLSLIEKNEQQLTETEYENVLASNKIEASYAGMVGKWIEPAIAPLGFDWKIGIALVTSFAAREIFVGTMATIYSVGSSEDALTIREKMAKEINPATGKPRYDMATALSLLLFYVFALQCMSTLAITKKETGSWKWPALQFTYMGVLAYLASYVAYTVFA